MVTKQLADLSAKTALISNSMTQLSVASQQIAVQQRTNGIENEVQYMKMITEAVVSQVMDVEGTKARLLKPYLQEVIREVISTECQRVEINRPRKDSVTTKKPFDIATRRGEAENPTSTTTNMTTFDRLEITRAHQAITVYHNAWIGTVTLYRKAMVSKARRPGAQSYDTQSQVSQTIIQFKFASWLSNARLDLTLEKLLSLSGAPKLGFSLETVRYINMPDRAKDAVRDGDLNLLYRVLTEQKVCVKSRDSFAGKTLLDLSLVALAVDWVHSDERDKPSKAPQIASTALWLLSQGIERKESEAEDMLRSWMFLGLSDVYCADREAHLRNMEKLLLESTSNSPPIMRARVLVMFGILNSDHSNDLDIAILDLLNEGATEDDLAELQRAANAFWELGLELIDPGVESIIVSSMLQMLVTREAHISKVEVLKGPRRLILGLLAMAVHPQDWSGGIRFIASILRLCRPMAILDDGFGEVVSGFACRRHILPVWVDALKLADYSFRVMPNHLAADQHIQAPLMVGMTCCTDDGNPDSLNPTIITVADPHDQVGSAVLQLWHSLEKPSGASFHSHKHADDIEVCQVERSGTEIIFDCDIANPLFPDPTRWASERQHWADLEEAIQHFTSIESEDIFVDCAPVDAPSSGFLTEVAAGTISFLTCIV